MASPGFPAQSGPLTAGMASPVFPAPRVAHPPWAWHLRCSQPPGGPPTSGMASLGFPTPQVARSPRAWPLQ
eukprot:8370965-Alexandrium_andersonii.AAC.1